MLESHISYKGAGLRPATLIKKTPTKFFSCELWKILRTLFFYKTPNNCYCFCSFPLDTGHHVDKECEDKDDGLYPTKDFFQYLECTSNQGTHHKCPPNHVFDPEERKCVDGKGLSKDTFCDNRKDGNYQNPWDCHSYISCVATQFIERPCAVQSLVYNPYKDACEYSGEYECNQITGMFHNINWCIHKPIKYLKWSFLQN